MKFKRKNVFLIVTFVIAAVGIAAYINHEYNRTNEMSEDLKADYYTNVNDLIREFEQDNIAASKKYVGKILEMNGLMLALEDDQNGNFTTILGSDSILSKVRCSMDSSANITELKSINNNQNLTIKGICTGYNPDDMGLGADIILNKCLIIKK